MPAEPNAETATKLRQQILACERFLFLPTGNSLGSRWWRWELGYADGKKPNQKIAIVPTRDGQTPHGSEYLQLYRRIKMNNLGGLGIFNPNTTSGYKVSGI